MSPNAAASGRLIKLNINGNLFVSNKHALKVFWTQAWCYVLLR